MHLDGVTDNIFLVQGMNKGRFPYSHSILIVDEDVVLIDTGCGIKTLKRIREQYEVDYLINSHTHPDHSAGNWIFRDKPIHVPEEGFKTSGNLNALSQRFAGKQLARFWIEYIRKNMEFRACEPTRSFSYDTIFNFGNTKLKALFTPGHTKDHYSFFEPKGRILFSFDYDLTSFPWYGHKESSIPEFRESIKKLKALSPKIVVSSHRGLITKKIEAEFEEFLRRLSERDQKILSLLKNRRTIAQLVELAPIYGRFPYAEPLLQYWESQMIKKHLKQLESEGKVRRISGTFYERVTS